MLTCELCAYGDRLLFRYATEDLFRQHLELVHGLNLDDDGRSRKPLTDPIRDSQPEPSVVTPKPRW